MRNGIMLQITTVLNSGATLTDNRPGHSVAGLMYHMDRFQREISMTPATVNRRITSYYKSIG